MSIDLKTLTAADLSKADRRHRMGSESDEYVRAEYLGAVSFWALYKVIGYVSPEMLESLDDPNVGWTPYYWVSVVRAKIDHRGVVSFADYNFDTTKYATLAEAEANF